MKPIVAITVLVSVFASVPSWATDYSGVDCNDKETRRNLLELFDDVEDELKAIDTYDQRTLKTGKNVLICEGTYELSDNSKWRMRFEQGENSLGDPVYSFTPLSEL